MSVTLPEDDVDWHENEQMRLLNVPEVFVLTGGTPQLGVRFVKLFQQTWSLMPYDAIGQITAHWCPDPKYIPERIVLQPAGQGRIDNATLAITLRSGHRIEFNQQVVARSPDRPLIGLIVHELAHVYGHAIRDKRHKDEYQSDEEQEQTEESVKVILKAWGLDGYDEELQEWVNDNPEWYEERAEGSTG